MVFAWSSRCVACCTAFRLIDTQHSPIFHAAHALTLPLLFFLSLCCAPSPFGVWSSYHVFLTRLEGGEAASLLLKGGSLNEARVGSDAAADAADPDAKRRKTEVGSPPPPSTGSGAPVLAPVGGTLPPAAPSTPGAAGVPANGPAALLRSSTDFAFAAASAIAGATASGGAAAPSAASQSQVGTPGAPALLSSIGSAPAPTPPPIDEEEEEDGEYDPTASQFVPGVQAQPIGGGGFVLPPQMRPPTGVESGGLGGTALAAPARTALVSAAGQPNGHPPGVVSPPAVAEQAAFLGGGEGGVALAASEGTPAPTPSADAAPVGVVAPPARAVTGAPGVDAAAVGGGGGTESSAALQSGSPAPAAGVPPNEPDHSSGTPSAPMGAGALHLSLSRDVLVTTSEGDSQSGLSTPPPPTTAELDVETKADSSQAVHPPSPPIAPGAGQGALPDTVAVESEEVRAVLLAWGLPVFADAHVQPRCAVCHYLTPVARALFSMLVAFLWRSALMFAF